MYSNNLRGLGKMPETTTLRLRASIACVIRFLAVFLSQIYVALSLISTTLANQSCMLYSARILN
jgi:hypothetical protein